LDALELSQNIQKIHFKVNYPFKANSGCPVDAALLTLAITLLA